MVKWAVLIFLLIILFYFANISEGFTSETIYERGVDRVNPLAANENPLKNKVSIGISQGDGVSERTMYQTALNIPTALSGNALSFSQVSPNNQVSPRIDNENSAIGLSKFCKDNGVGERPFDNTKFNENCGMCVTSGYLYDKSSFNTPTGMLVYKADKDQFTKEKAANGYPFTRAIPSLGIAVCGGATKGSDTEAVLAITQQEFDEYIRRSKCMHKNGTDCGTCLTNKKYSWIDASGGLKPSKIVLWGTGKASVSLNGVKRGSTNDLSPTNPTEYELGSVKEGVLVQIDLETENTGVDPPSLFGILASTTPTGGLYTLTIDQFLKTDMSTGSSPRRGLPRSFTVFGKTLSIIEIKAQLDKTSLALTGSFPLTFVESTQLAAND